MISVHEKERSGSFTMVELLMLRQTCVSRKHHLSLNVQQMEFRAVSGFTAETPISFSDLNMAC